MPRRTLALIIAVFVPLLALACWVVLNQQYPISDSSQEALVSYKIFSAWDHAGVWEALKSAYLVRDNIKPVLYPVLTAPAFIALSGDILWSVRACCLISYLIYLLTSFWAFSFVLPTIETALATLAVGLVPWSISNQHFYNLEIPSLTANIAALGWLWRVRKFDSDRSARWFGALFGLSLCIRPSEAVNFFLAPTVLWLGIGLFEKRIRIKDLLVWTIAFLPLLYYFATTLPAHPTGLVRMESLGQLVPIAEPSATITRLLVMLVPSGALFFFRKKLSLNSSLAWTAAIVFVSVSLWYAPFMNRLHLWLLAGSFGETAQKFNTARAGLSVPLKIGRWFLGLPFIPIAVAGLLTLGTTGLLRTNRRLMMLAAVPVLFPVLIGMYSFNSTIRYYFSPTWMLYGFALYLALSPEFKWRRARASLVGVFIAFCLYWNFSATYSPSTPLSLLDPSDGELNYRVTPLRKTDPIRTWVETLVQHYPQKKMRVALMCALPLMPYENPTRTFGVFRTKMISQELGVDWDFDYAESIGDSKFIDKTDLLLYGPTSASRLDSSPINQVLIQTLTRLGWHNGGSFTMDLLANHARFLVFDKIPRP